MSPLHANTSVTSVTVYRKVAEVVRSFAVDLQPGRNLVRITHLSGSIETQLLRVSRLTGNASVLDVQCEVDAFVASLPADDDSETRRSLLLRKRELEDERKVQDQGLSLFVDYARTLNSAHTAPGDAVNFLDAFMAGRRSTVATIRKLDDELAEIDKALKGPVSDPSVQGDVNGRATIAIIASEPYTAEVDITYDVKNASWEPYYNLHATTVNGQPSPTVAVQYNARVTHTSGEDWTGINMNFVAADAPRRAQYADIPSVAPRKLHRLPAPFASGYPNGFPPSSLFRQNTSATPPTQLTGGSLFGAPATESLGSSMFGAQQQSMMMPQTMKANPPVAPSSGSLFGSVSSSAPQPSRGQGVFSAFGQAALATLPLSNGPSLFGQAPQSVADGQAATSGGTPFGSQASRPANSGGSFSTPQGSTTKAPDVFGGSAPTAKLEIDDGSDSAVNGAIPDMRVTALGEKVVVRESTSTRDVRLAAETKASVASDGLGHAVPIMSLVLDASFTWVCVPRSRAAAFVECHTKNSSAHTLVAGPITVYVDGQEVAKTTLKDIKPQDTLVAPLGVDDAVRVVHRRTARTEEGPERPFVERLWTTACTARYAVTNKHTFAIPKLLLRDALPVSANPQIAVVVKAVHEKDPHAADNSFAAGNTPGDAVLGKSVRQPEGREGEGMFEWVRGVEAGQTVVLQAVWEIHTPSGVSWEEMPLIRP